MRRHGVFAVLLLTGCATTGTTRGLALPSVALRPEDRVLLGEFTRVTAIAATLDHVYIAYPAAVGIWRPLEHRWEVPRTAPDRVLMAGVFAAMTDPLDQSLWLVARNGWLHYQADLDRWDSGNSTTPLTGIGIDPSPASNGVWLQSGGRWLSLSRIGGALVPGNPPAGLRLPATFSEAVRDVPALNTYASMILAGPELQRGNFTAVARSGDGRGWFVGTDLHGAVYLDRTGGAPEYLGFGLPGNEVGALATGDAGRLWVATDRTGDRLAALTEIGEDLVAVTSRGTGRAVGLPFAETTSILPTKDGVWLATDQGAVQISASGRVESWNETRRLADRRALSLAAFGAQIAVGTLRGLVTIDTAGKVTRRDPAFQQPVTALAAFHDTLWVGTAVGLYALLPKDSVLQIPTGLRGALGNRQAVVGIGRVADTLVALTPDALFWCDPLTGAWSSGPPFSTQLGALVGLVVTPGGIWVAGERGAGLTRPGAPLLSRLMTPQDLPGPVTSIASSNGWLWLGTRAGLVRVRLNSR